MRLLRFLLPPIFVLMLFAAPPAGAADPPFAWVGRVAAADGGLSVRPAAGEWTAAAVNYPIAAGMAVRTDGKGRAALRIGAEMIALAPNTEIVLPQLDAAGCRIALHQGRIAVRLSRLEAVRDIAVEMPGGAVRLLEAGDYDIAAGDAHASARVAVLDGRARIVGKGIDAAVAAGAVAALSGTDPVTASAGKAAADGFDAWWRTAYGTAGNLPALRYLSPEMTGYAALDAAGRWREEAPYGAVWLPGSLPAGWAPYRFGRWRWIAPWGWSWIDDAGWGFAPSHFGRWARIADPASGGERWAWVPGRLVAGPVYMPAAVAFLGTAGVGLSYPDSSGPAVGWFPLAPGEAYWPSYTSDLATIRRINRGAVADPTKIGPGIAGGPPAGIVNGAYKNRRFASVVPRAVFVAGRPVATALIRLPDRRLDNAPLLAGSPRIAPPAAAAPAAAPKVARARRVVSPKSKSHARVATRAARRGRIATHVRRVAARHAAFRRRAVRHALARHRLIRRRHLRRAHLRRIAAALAHRPGARRHLRLAAARRR
jgi:Family of unknown function (DUF6600)